MRVITVALICLIILVLSEAPLVTPTPAFQSFVTGSKVQIGCGAVAYPNPTYVWKRYGSVLPSNNRKYSVSRGGILTIRDLQPADKGQYECVATNIAGTGSGLATLTYIGKCTATLVISPGVLVSVVGKVAEKLIGNSSQYIRSTKNHITINFE